MRDGGMGSDRHPSQPKPAGNTYSALNSQLTTIAEDLFLVSFLAVAPDR